MANITEQLAASVERGTRERSERERVALSAAWNRGYRTGLRDRVLTAPAPAVSETDKAPAFISALLDAHPDTKSVTFGPAFNTEKQLFRIYTEFSSTIDYAAIVGRYFDGATITTGVGLDARTQADSETAVIVEIVSSAPDALQRAVFLAGDLRVLGDQKSVLLTRQHVHTFEIVG